MSSKSSVPEFRVGTTTIGTSAGQLTPLGFRVFHHVYIQADSGNTGLVYVGHNAHVTSSNGWELDAGEAIEIEIDDPSKIWIIGSDANQKVKWVLI